MSTKVARTALALRLVLLLHFGTSCTVQEPEEDAGPRTPSVCSTLQCPAWTRCVVRPDAGCVDAVKSLRWLLPPADASVPFDTTRIAFELEVDGTITQVPIRSMPEGAPVAYRVDGGRLFGWLDLRTPDAGLVSLAAGWPGGPDASVAVQISHEPSLEIVGSNPPTYGANTDTFQPNDPDGPAWRRDDLVPIRPWPGSSITARQDQPDAAITVMDAGGAGDGGSYLRLQDVEFNAFRGGVTISAAGSFWEAAPQRIMVTRWRWQRVVGGVPRPLQIHQPRPAVISPGSMPGIVVATRDTETSGTLVQFDAEGRPTSAFAGWNAAVTTPYFSDVGFVAGADSDGGFIYRAGFGIQRIDAPVVRAGAFSYKVVAATADGRILFVSYLRDVPLEPGCDFDGGQVAQLVTGNYETFVSSEDGTVCQYPHGQDAGLISLRVRPSSLSGPARLANVTASNGDAWQFMFGANGNFIPFPTGPANAEFILREVIASGERLISATPSRLEVYQGAGLLNRPIATTQLVSSLPLAARLATSPLLRFNGTSRILFAVDVTGTLTSYEAPGLRPQWSWRPAGGLQLSAPLGFSPLVTRLGSLLLVVDNRLLVVISDGESRMVEPGSWLMEGGTVTGCHDLCYFER